MGAADKYEQEDRERYLAWRRSQPLLGRIVFRLFGIALGSTLVLLYLLAGAPEAVHWLASWFAT